MINALPHYPEMWEHSICGGLTQSFYTKSSFTSTRTGESVPDSELTVGDSALLSLKDPLVDCTKYDANPPHESNHLYGTEQLYDEIRIDPDQSRSSKRQQEDRVRNPCRVFIGGIGQGTVESTIREHFSQCGTVCITNLLLLNVFYRMILSVCGIIQNTCLIQNTWCILH